MEVAVGIAVLVLPIVPILRLAACRPFVRRLRGAPEVAIGGIAILLAYVTGLVAVAVAAPFLLLPLAALAVAAMAAAWWRSRPDYGVKRGWPRGSLRVAPLGPWVDPDYFARDAERFGPIFKTTTFLSPVVCVVGLPAARDLFRHHDDGLVPPPNRFGRFIPRGFLRSMTNENHAHYGPLLRAAISGAVTRSAMPDMRRIMHAELAAAVEQSQAPSQAPSPAVVGRLTKQLVYRLFLRLFFGLRALDAPGDRLEQLFEILDPMNAWRYRDSRIDAALDEFAELVSEHATDDSYLGAARLRDPQVASDPTFVKNLVYAAQTGGFDLAGLFAWITWMLGANPEWIERLRLDAQPAQAARRIVQETLRLEQSEFLTRTTTREIRWNGFTIPRGWRVRVCVRESHRAWSGAEFNPDRWLDTSRSSADYSPFGTSTTRATCLGEGLTLTLGALFVEELLTSFDWSVARNAGPEFSGIHWRPGAAFQIRLSARTMP